MKLLSRSFIPTVVVLSAMLSGALRGDVVVLKSGQRYEGKVTSEDAASVTMEYRPTPNTKDTRTISKSDIQQVIRLTPSQAEFAERNLDKVLPSADLLSEADYERIIQDQLRSFANKYPGTPEAEQVEKFIKDLSDEKARVSKGELKVDGKWLTADDVRRDAYEIEAYRLRQAMKAAAADTEDTRYLVALTKFNELQTQYPASLNFVKAVSEAVEILDSFIKQLNGMIAEEPILSQRRANGLKSLEGSNAQATKAAIDQEVAAFKAKVANEKKNKVKWVSFYKYDAVSLKASLAQAIKERTTLGTMDLESLRLENEQLSSILRNLADEKVVQAREKIAALPRATMINKTALTKIEAQLREVEADLKERDKREANAKVIAQTTQPSEGKTTDGAGNQQNALAEALRKAQEGKGKPTDKTAEDAKKSETPASKATPKLEVEEESGSSFADYIPIAGGVLVVILLVAFFLGKKKPKEEEAK